MNLNSSTYYEPVEICPLCGAAISPVHIASGRWSSSQQISYDDHFSVLSCCNACHQSFIMQFSEPNNKTLGASGIRFSKLDFVAPTTPQKVVFESELTDISPMFEIIYNQSLAAEVYGLNEISGAGYRRALEFLVKDYLIYEKPEETDLIRKKHLGNCINDIDHPKLQAIAKRATWLGNDLTHYEQRYTDRDIEDLKLLIKLTSHWVAFNLQSDSAIKDISYLAN